MKKIGLAFGIALASSALAQPGTPRFSADAFRSHVAFLADDLLEGRDTGSRGNLIAARYMAAQFMAAGLTPAGAAGGWYQMVPLREARLVEGSASLTIGDRRIANGDGVIIGASVFEEKQSYAGDVVFAGHCLYEPKLKIDDFQGLDVKGKIVACLPGFPKGLPSETAAFLTEQRPRFVARHGGIGQITLWTTAQEKLYPFKRAAQVIGNPRMERLNPDGSVFQFAPGLLIGGSVSPENAAALFAGAPRSFADVEKAGETASIKGFALKPRIAMTRVSSWRSIESPNVVGMVKGTDPSLSAQVVVLGGHLDHVGIGTPVNGDAIYNGALDNAAGSATLIEVAKATAAAPPKRSVLFLSATAEEKGLLGAGYFAENPTVPKASIVAMVDLDQPMLTYDFIDVTAYGAEHSSVAQFVEAAAAEMGVKLAPDPVPEEVVFVRSDHYAFVQNGIPAVVLATGFGGAGKAAWATYNENNYHQPSDDMSLPIRWEQGARFAELNWRITRLIADSPEPPRWYRGDFFGDLFAPNSPRAAAPKR